MEKFLWFTLFFLFFSVVFDWVCCAYFVLLMYNCCFYLYISNFVASASLLFLYICYFCLNLLFIHLHITVFCVLSLISISFLDAFFSAFFFCCWQFALFAMLAGIAVMQARIAVCAVKISSHTHTHSHTSCHQDWTDDYRQTFILTTWCKNEDILIVIIGIIWNELKLRKVYQTMSSYICIFLVFHLPVQYQELCQSVVCVTPPLQIVLAE